VVSAVRRGCCILLLHVCDQARLKLVKLGMIIMCLYLCSITSRSTARSVIRCGPAWRKSCGKPCICTQAQEANERGRGMVHAE
jgi:hypothetical protein